MMKTILGGILLLVALPAFAAKPGVLLEIPMPVAGNSAWKARSGSV